MKHMATKHREDTGVILTCRAWMLEICWQFHEQLIHYQLIQLTTLKLTTVKLTCCLMAEMTDSRQLIEKIVLRNTLVVHYAISIFSQISGATGNLLAPDSKIFDTFLAK